MPWGWVNSWLIFIFWWIITLNTYCYLNPATTFETAHKSPQQPPRTPQHCGGSFCRNSTPHFPSLPKRVYKLMPSVCLSRHYSFLISQISSLKYTSLFFSPPSFLSNLLFWSSQWIVFISHGNNSCRRSQPLFSHSSAWRQYEAIRCMWVISELSFFQSQCFVALRDLTIWSNYIYVTGLIGW